MPKSTGNLDYELKQPLFYHVHVLVNMMCYSRCTLLLLLLLLLFKKRFPIQGWKSAFTPYQSKDPSPKIPAYRKKYEKGKTVEVKSGESTMG